VRGVRTSEQLCSRIAFDCRSRQAALGLPPATGESPCVRCRSSPPGREPSGRRSGVGSRIGGGKAPRPVAGSSATGRESDARLGRRPRSERRRTSLHGSICRWKTPGPGQTDAIDVARGGAGSVVAVDLGFPRPLRSRHGRQRSGSPVSSRGRKRRGETAPPGAAPASPRGSARSTLPKLGARRQPSPHPHPRRKADQARESGDSRVCVS
jgi:hypothetical protein